MNIIIVPWSKRKPTEHLTTAQALTKDISTPADIAPSALETIIFYCFMGCINALTCYLLLLRADLGYGGPGAISKHHARLLPRC